MSDVINVSVVNPVTQNMAAGSQPALVGGKSGEALVTQLQPRLYNQAYWGNLFMGSTAAAGAVIPIYTTLTPIYSLWNPAGSGVNLVLDELLVGWTSTAAALGTIGYAYTANAGSGISSTAPFVAFGAGTPVNCLLGGGASSKARLATSGTTTLVAAATWVRSSGITTLATTAATVGPMFVCKDNIDGALIMPPSSAVHIMGSTAVAITATMTLIWHELPV